MQRSTNFLKKNRSSHILRSCVILSCSALLSLPLCANDYTSHTVLVPHPHYHDVSPEKIALFHQIPVECCDGLGSGFQVVALGSTSVNTAEMARYFLPFGKTQIVAGEAGSEAVSNGSVDVLAQYFGIKTAESSFDQKFQSTLQFAPKQNVAGAGLSYVQDFNVFGQALRFSAHSSLLRVHNNLHAKETITNSGGSDNNPEVPTGYVGSLMDAFTGKTIFGDQHFNCGKIAPCGLTKWGLGDIEVTIGNQNSKCNDCQRGWWAGVIIPTGNKPKGEYLFEPIVGNNHHLGVIFGGYYHHFLWSNNADKEIWVHFHSQSRHLFGNKQRRAVDLVDKQWGRYLWLYPDKDAEAGAVQPGINHFTMQVDVNPRSVLNINSAITYACNGLALEGGMNTFARQSEKVSPKCAYNSTVAIAGDIEDTPVKSRKKATIRYFDGISDDNNYTTIKEFDLNFASAAQPSTLCYIFYGSMGYQWKEIHYPAFIMAGLSYEYSADNAGLERFVGWVKSGVAF
jgi:hypothetical protein